MLKATVIGLLAIPLLAMGALFVMSMLAGGSAGGTLSTGRSVMTYSESISLSSTFSSDTATIRTAGKTIVVEPTRLVVDGITVARINKDVSDIDVHVKRGAIEFVADK